MALVGTLNLLTVFLPILPHNNLFRNERKKKHIEVEEISNVP
jgi:hypothetical protein